MSKFLTEGGVFQSEGKIKTVVNHEHIQEREEYPSFLIIWKMSNRKNGALRKVHNHSVRNY